jgi:Ca2+-binding RTX toxin-like protein
MQLPITAGRRRWTFLAAALPALLAAVALPAAADAGTASTLPGGALLYSDAASERNDVTMRFAGGKIVITDTAPPRTETSQCKIVNGDLECAPSADVRVILGAGDDKIQYRLPHQGLVQMGAGNDFVAAGTRETQGLGMQPVTYLGEQGRDTISYTGATSGVTVDMGDGLPDDGRPGERENVAAGFELFLGSAFGDTVLGTTGRDEIVGFDGRDVIAGGGGDDVFHSPLRDGADDYHGGPGRDTIEYAGRTQPLNVSLDNITNDGESGEFDLVRSNVENINGGAGADTLNSFTAFSRLDGRQGADTLIGGAGADTLIGGPGADSVDAGSENDVVDARDGEPDAIDCGPGTDSASVDTVEGRVRGCESGQVGVLTLASRAIDATAGMPVRVQLSWRHPRSWRSLRSVDVTVYRDDLAAGAVRIRPRGGLSADGAVELVRRASRVTHRGRRASARLALRLDPSLAGARLRIEVEATDTRGRRQLERRAGTIRVAQ